MQPLATSSAAKMMSPLSCYPPGKFLKNHANSFNFTGRVAQFVSFKEWLLARWRRWVIGLARAAGCLAATAHRLAADQASTAVVAALTPICVEKFLQNSDAQANLGALRKISANWQQGQYVEKGGWATRPGATSSDYELARACAAKLTEAKAASQ